MHYLFIHNKLQKKKIMKIRHLLDNIINDLDLNLNKKKCIILNCIIHEILEKRWKKNLNQVNRPEETSIIILRSYIITNTRIFSLVVFIDVVNIIFFQIYFDLYINIMYYLNISLEYKLQIWKITKKMHLYVIK